MTEWAAWSSFLAMVGAFLVMCLVTQIRNRRALERAIARVRADGADAEGRVGWQGLPCRYTRVEWMRDIESDLSIEEIHARCIASGGSWRRPPADPPPPASGLGAGVGSGFSNVLGALCCVAPLAFLLFDPPRRRTP